MKIKPGIGDLDINDESEVLVEEDENGGEENVNRYFQNLFDKADSLEKVIALGPSPNDVRQDKEKNPRINASGIPEIVRSTIRHLRGKHRNLQHESDVCRLLTKAGIKVVEKLPGLKEIRRRNERIYFQGDDMQRFLSHKHNGEFILKKENAVHHFQMTVYVFEWVLAKCQEIASDLGIHKSSVVVMCLLAGMSLSKNPEWVAPALKARAYQEIKRFADWVLERSKT